MLLNEIKQLIKPNEPAQGAPEIEVLDMYKERQFKKPKGRTEKVTIKDSKTGKIYGYRTVVQ